MAAYRDVMVYCEVVEGKLAAITTEVLSYGRKLVDQLGEELCGVLVGSDISNIAQETILFGADKVYIVENPFLQDYQPDSYVAVMEKVIKEAKPRFWLSGQTTIGRDLAPRLAFRLRTTATLDCIELAVDPKSRQLLQTKPIYGGNALAIFTSESYPQIATVRATSVLPLEPDASRKGQIIDIDVCPEELATRIKVLQKKIEEVEGIRLEDARVVVAGGRGISGAAGFSQLAELVRVLNGAIAGSRPPCDNSWIPNVLQIGLTGKTVAPELYIAVGISGASQHMSGCARAKTIVAINSDSDANIFKYAHFGIIGDWKKVIPAFTNKVKKLVTPKE